MLTRIRTRSVLALFAANALGLFTTGCSSAENQAAFNSLRGFASAARPTRLAAAATKVHAAAIQRHARPNALSSVRTTETLHHQSARSL